VYVVSLIWSVIVCLSVC